MHEIDTEISNLEKYQNARKESVKNKVKRLFDNNDLISEFVNNISLANTDAEIDRISKSIDDIIDSLIKKVEDKISIINDNDDAKKILLEKIKDLKSSQKSTLKEIQEILDIVDEKNDINDLKKEALELVNKILNKEKFQEFKVKVNDLNNKKEIIDLKKELEKLINKQEKVEIIKLKIKEELDKITENSNWKKDFLEKYNVNDENINYFKEKLNIIENHFEIKSFNLNRYPNGFKFDFLEGNVPEKIKVDVTLNKEINNKNLYLVLIGSKEDNRLVSNKLEINDKTRLISFSFDSQEIEEDTYKLLGVFVDKSLDTTDLKNKKISNKNEVNDIFTILNKGVVDLKEVKISKYSETTQPIYREGVDLIEQGANTIIEITGFFSKKIE
ncbi:hypothetical protein [Mycoplasma sp. CSL7503-lung]|uniref:hypothetical protein n=1 Tax=Mycoplasma sp. CSL7503-lung TaxID=536372 RepID=UPI0021D3CF42|nr:hypothetical protein [Mycoplasma sp. CSL7503-lung]MCU4706777.1 hypothetical protein [Mycoplasma sp. CSL7503-lung]